MMDDVEELAIMGWLFAFAHSTVVEEGILFAQVYATLVLLSVLAGAVIVTLSGWNRLNGHVEAVKVMVIEEPGWSAGIGVGTVTAGFLTTMVLGIGLAFASNPSEGMADGALELFLAVIMFVIVSAGMVIALLGFVLATVALGSAVGRWLGYEDTSQWRALVAGALVVNAPIASAVLVPAALLCGTGALVRQVWAVLRRPPSPKNQ